MENIATAESVAAIWFTVFFGAICLKNWIICIRAFRNGGRV